MTFTIIQIANHPALQATAEFVNKLAYGEIDRENNNYLSVLAQMQRDGKLVDVAEVNGVSGLKELYAFAQHGEQDWTEKEGVTKLADAHSLSVGDIVMCDLGVGYIVGLTSFKRIF